MLELFLKSSRVSILALRASWQKDDPRSWRLTAHAMKGISLNIGAFPLSQLCDEAENNNALPAHEKEPLLIAVENELAVVCRLLREAL